MFGVAEQSHADNPAVSNRLALAIADSLQEYLSALALHFHEGFHHEHRIFPPGLAGLVQGNTGVGLIDECASTGGLQEPIEYGGVLKRPSALLARLWLPDVMQKQNRAMVFAGCCPESLQVESHPRIVHLRFRVTRSQSIHDDQAGLMCRYCNLDRRRVAVIWNHYEVVWGLRDSKMPTDCTRNINNFLVSILQVVVHHARFPDLVAEERFAFRDTQPELISPRSLSEAGISNGNMDIVGRQEPFHDIVHWGMGQHLFYLRNRISTFSGSRGSVR